MAGSWKLYTMWDCSDGAPSTPTVERRIRVEARSSFLAYKRQFAVGMPDFMETTLFPFLYYNRYSGALADGRLGMALSQ